MIKKLAQECPGCGGRLSVKRLACEGCETAVEGTFKLPVLAALSPEEQEYILHFIKASGSLKEMAAISGKSYPSVRNYLDEIIEKIKTLEKQ